EQRELLLEVGVDAAEKDALLADVDFVGAQRRVAGNEQCIVPERDQGGGERVVVQTTAAEHAPRAGANVRDSHGYRSVHGLRLRFVQRFLTAIYRGLLFDFRVRRGEQERRA